MKKLSSMGSGDVQKSVKQTKEKYYDMFCDLKQKIDENWLN